MRVFPIDDPVNGEQLLAVEPAIAPYPDAQWRQRLEYFRGRALTHAALEQEQRNRSGRLATLGQAVSAGVVSGLEVSANTNSDGQTLLEISAGFGVAASGEIVNINRNQQVLLEDIRVFAPADVLDGSGSSTTSEGAYRLGDSLGELKSQSRPLAEAMVLVLQPAEIEYYAHQDSDDPCDYDVSDEAFENWQWVDGCRLVLYNWPLAIGSLPVAGNWRRNRIAHAIYEFERTLAEDQLLPWCSVGIPVALIGFNTTLDFEFIDRNAVVRRGGESKGVDVPISPAGNRFLWQAQFEQFNEQLADTLESNPTLEPSQMNAGDWFRYLSPVGVLPKETMTPRQQKQKFFPLSYSVRALAIPYEQLDLAIEESASLLPFDLNTPDRLEVLVPVLQQFYEPQLLVIEQVDDEFDLTIERFTIVRNQWLGRRANVRAKASSLNNALKGVPLLYKAEDPNAIDSLEQLAEFEHALVAKGGDCVYRKGESAAPLNWYQIDFDDTQWQSGVNDMGYGGADVGTKLEDMKGKYVTIYIRHHFTIEDLAQAHRYTLSVTTNGGFYAYLNNRFLYSNNVRRPMFDSPAATELEETQRDYELGDLTGRLIEGENVIAIMAHNASLEAANFRINIELLDTEDKHGTQIKLYDDQSQKPETEEYLVDEILDLKNDIVSLSNIFYDELDKLDELGVEQYIKYLEQKIDQADDRVEFGFLRLRTDIYRVRQIMLGNEAATKLATSPVLAEIAKGDSAVATKAEVSDYYQRLVQAQSGRTDLEGRAPQETTSNTPATMTYINYGGFPGYLYLNNDWSNNTTTKSGSAPLDKSVAGRSEKVDYARRYDLADQYLAFASAKDVSEQAPIVGKVQEFNNATVGERLADSSANTVLNSGIAVKGEMLSDLLTTDLKMDDIHVPGVDKTLAEIKSENLIGNIIKGDYDKASYDDEAGLFDAGVKAMEHMVAVLRQVERRIYLYKKAVARCKTSVSTLRALLGNTDLRLKTIEDELAEARHDVSVARALKAEEQIRVDTLNEKRDKVLESQVPFLLFRRPRTLDPRIDAPMHYINPDLSDLPLMTCDLSELETPESLDAMMDVIREAPLKWFNAVNVIMPKLSRLADLHVTLSGAKKRATMRSTQHPFMNINFQAQNKLLFNLGTTLVKMQKRVLNERKKTSAIDLLSYQHLSWKDAVKRVPEVVSMGDLIDGSHGRIYASRIAAEELDRITRIVSCLYVQFSEIPASMRLDWAELLSQYDDPVNLRNLYVLPRFADLDYIDRYNMQRQVDWLFGRINGQYRDAFDLMNDLVRVALLAASHAPVDQLIAGQLAEPETINVGSHIKVIADLTRVRIGMAVSMESAGMTKVRGKVSDIVDGHVIAQVLATTEKSIQMDSKARVQIGERIGMRF